jgi:hypothetical protein
MFEPFGEINHYKVVKDKVTNAPLGYGFVRFSKPECMLLCSSRANLFCFVFLLFYHATLYFFVEVSTLPALYSQQGAWPSSFFPLFLPYGTFLSSFVLFLYCIAEVLYQALLRDMCTCHAQKLLPFPTYRFLNPVFLRCPVHSRASRHKHSQR